MNTLKTTFLLGAMTGLLLAMGEVLGGRDGMTLALIMAGVMNFGAWFWSDKIVLRMYSAQPVGPSRPPSCTRSWSGLALKAGMPMPQLYVIPDPAPERLRHRPQPVARRGGGHRRGILPPWTARSWKACSPTSSPT